MSAPFLRPFSRSILLSACGTILIAALSRHVSAAHTRRVCFKDSCVFTEIADTEELRSRGLMFRTGLNDGWGMLFVFEQPGKHSFWMKNTLIPLDMLWLDGSMKVVDIKTFVPPCTGAECPVYTPRTEAAFVLEVNAGFVDEHRISVGDVVRFYDE